MFGRAASSHSRLPTSEENETSPDVADDNDCYTTIESGEIGECKTVKLEESEGCTDGDSPQQTDGASMKELISTPGVKGVLSAYFLISFSSIAFDEVIPLWAMASRKHGGLAFPQKDIGILMTSTGFILTFYTFVVYPKLAKALGRTRGFRTGVMIAVPSMLIITVLPKLASPPADFFLLILMYASSKAGVGLGFANLALIGNGCVDKSRRGSLNGLIMSCGSCSKTVGPISAAILFAWTLGNGLYFPFDFHLLFILVSIAALSCAFITLSEHAAEDVDQRVKSDLNEVELFDGVGSHCREPSQNKVNPNYAPIPLSSAEEDEEEYGLQNLEE